MTPPMRPTAARLVQAGLLLASLLVLPLAVLLFGQWPLREWVQAWSREANDMGQICFAWYVAVAVTAASVTHSHMAAHTPLQSAHPPARNWRPWALLFCLTPWALFMLWAAAPQIRVSVAGLEKFAESLTPGYFMVKLALALMLVLVLVNALADVLRHRRK